MSNTKDPRVGEDEYERGQVVEGNGEETRPSSSIDDDTKTPGERATDVEQLAGANETTDAKEESGNKQASSQTLPSKGERERVEGGEEGGKGEGEVSGKGEGESSGKGVIGGKEGRRSVVGGDYAGVGEWNSLPILVERLRSALDRIDPSITSQPAILEDSGIDSEEDLRIRNSMERACGFVDVNPLDGAANTHDTNLKRNLEILGDELPFQDVRTALNRLRDTLDRIDLTNLTACDSAAISDPSDRLHLVQLVSALLTRLDASAEKKTVHGSPPIAQSTAQANRRRRSASRHTIAITVEELARARKRLEEEGNCSMDLHGSIGPKDGGPSFARSTKDALSTMHRNVARPAIGTPPNTAVDRSTATYPDQTRTLAPLSLPSPTVSPTFSPASPLSPLPAIVTKPIFRDQRRSSYDESGTSKVIHGQYGISLGNESDRKMLRPRPAEAESTLPGIGFHGRCQTGNKFSAKKAKMKRANTIDIPSYLAMQGESLGKGGCLPLRRPIAVADKPTVNNVSTGNPAIPYFRPKTENDRKFLALINRNNEPPGNNVPSHVVPPAFGKHFPNPRALTDENWNNRFSNIKTAFDRSASTDERQANCRRSAKIGNIGSHGFQRFPQQENHQVVPTSTFRHAPSSLFRIIDKSTAPTVPTTVPATSSNANWSTVPWSKQSRTSNHELPNPGNSLRERARIMFDRESKNYPSGKCNEDVGNGPPPVYPRPPWIERERKAVVAENGRLDYRSFCKQFAPFVGRTNLPAGPKPNQIPNRTHQEEQRRTVERPSESRPIIPNVPSSVTMDDWRIRADACVQTETHEKEKIIVDGPSNLPPPFPIAQNVSNGHVYVNASETAEDTDDMDDSKIQPAIPVYEIPFVDDRNIANQDFGPEIGLVTRYSSAIVTVAAADESADRNGPTTQEEIKRHNELQRSLLQQLRSEQGPSPTNLSISSGRRVIPSQVDFAPSEIPANRVNTLRDVYEQPKNRVTIPNGGSMNTGPIDSSDEYLVSCANKSNRSIVLAKSESWHQLALSDRSSKLLAPPAGTALPPAQNTSSGSYHCRPPKPKSPSSMKLRLQKQYEASSTSDSVKRMEEKVRRYFKDPASDEENVGKDSSKKKRSSTGLSRSRTMPGIWQEASNSSLVPSRLTLPQVDGSTDFDKAFDDIFEETTRNNQPQQHHQHY